ncbi:DUF892 family protein [Patescibacteria group bacterium]|nr:DUF892 family protein [Patescibacteria group bacterium]
MAKIIDTASAFYLRIKTLYDIEKQLEMALPKMAEAATNPELEAGLLAHLEETKEQSQRLEQIFGMLEMPPELQATETIRALIADGDTVASHSAPDELRDVLIAGAGREVEHYEMAVYMNAIEEAKGLGLDDAVALLELSLAEETEAEETLEKAFKDNLEIAAETESELSDEIDLESEIDPASDMSVEEEDK